MLSTKLLEAAGNSTQPTYIEDVFSTYLYTGNGSTQTITNGIDLAGKGGLVWIKNRLQATNNKLTDTVRGATKAIISNTTGAQTTDANGLTSFNSNGFSIGTDTAYNISTNTYVSWTFRKQPKFFDVVTYTGNGAAGLPTRVINHNLGSAPGFVLIKCVTTGYAWVAWHRSVSGNGYLNSTAAFADNGFGISVTSTTVSFGAGNGAVNGNGDTFVMYLFAHNAGGFGLTGTDNVISCGSFTTDANGQFSVNLGYEPQFVITKSASGVSDWRMFDTMRGFVTPGTGSSLSSGLLANSSLEEIANWLNVGPNATGFATGANGDFAASSTFIYIAIRRGPMKVPTDATKAFVPLTLPLNSASGTVPVNAGLTTDMVFGSLQTNQSGAKYWASRLTGPNKLDSTFVYAEASGAYYWDNMVGVRQQETNFQPTWYFCKRAPSFFDEVCYTGDGASTKSVSHNLTVAPELIIAKKRSSISDWGVYAAGQADGALLNATDGFTISNRFTSVGATSFSVKLGGTPSLNDSGATYVAYLFATCPGVSKVGSYTGNGSTQTINCGFAGGARFVLIKRTDSTGDWYVWDTARGIVSGNDPYLLLNSTAAEVTTTDYIDPVSSGFEISSTAPAAINASGGSYIYLAIA